MNDDKVQKLIQDLMGFMTEDEYTELDKALFRAIVELRRKQREWVGLTVEDQADILGRKWWNFEDEFDLEGFLRVTEAKLKEKNGG